MPLRAFGLLLVAGMLALAAAGDAGAAGTSDRLARVKSTGLVRVCIWPDYYGITYRDPRSRDLRGLDVDLARALARDLGVRIEHVDSSFVKLVPDLLHDRCDVAMFAVGVTAERAASIRFSRPCLKSDIHAIAAKASRTVRAWEDIDRAGVVVAVAAGTFMEPVMRSALKQATLTVVAPPRTREEEVESGRADVFMTDFPYSRRLLGTADWARLVSPTKPFHVVSYAYAVQPGDDAWHARIEAFVAGIKRDGRLAAAARAHELEEMVVLE